MLKCNLPVSLDNLKLCFHTGKHWYARGGSDVDWQEGEQEYANLWASQNAEDFANKYTEDAIYINPKLGILRGREGEETPI